MNKSGAREVRLERGLERPAGFEGLARLIKGYDIQTQFKHAGLGE